MNSPTMPDRDLQSVYEQIFIGDHSFEVIRSRFGKQALHVTTPRGSGEKLFIKVYTHNSLIGRFKARMAATGGLHDWHICSRMAAIGIPVPRPVGKGCWPKQALLPRKTLFAQDWVKDGQPLSQLLRQKRESGNVDEQWLHRLYDEIGKFVAAIHQRGFFPRDLHPGNLLLRQPAPDAIRLELIDYESIRRRGPYRKNKAHLNLGHICSYLNTFRPTSTNG